MNPQLRGYRALIRLCGSGGHPVRYYGDSSREIAQLRWLGAVRDSGPTQAEVMRLHGLAVQVNDKVAQKWAFGQMLRLKVVAFWAEVSDTPAIEPQVVDYDDELMKAIALLETKKISPREATQCIRGAYRRAVLE
ncbi:MAG: hypothetical protein FOGNACKC_00728 [Anaerolineae bacterium]|nr:hypothetical protein [Anaerolineae bacterium]